MKMWIIYTKYYETNATYSPRMMKEAAINNNMDAEVYYSDYFSIVVKGNKQILYYKDEEVKCYPDLVFFRCYAFELMEYFDNKGIRLVNDYKGMVDVRDKFKTHQIVSELGIEQPKTIYVKYPDFNMLKESLRVPFVMKDNSGSRGNNVYLIDNELEMRNIMDNNPNIKFIFQEYISNSKGKDIRLYVVGDKVIGSITRMATSDDFRANVSLGAIGKELSIPASLENEAVNIAKRMGLNICSVDYLYSDHGYIFCEANGNAAFSAFIKLGYKMQDIFMKYIKTKYN